MKMKNKVNIGIVGAGRMGKVHAESISKIPQAKLVAICDIELKKAEELARKYGAEAYQEEEKIINHPSIEVIIIATPLPFHAKTIIKAAEKGKNIFCEKPLARTMEEGEEIEKAVNKNKVKFGIGFQKRFSWPEKRIKELIPLLGEPKAARITNVNAHYSRQRGDWFADFELCGGYILDSMIHYFDLFRWYFGEVKSVYAQGLLLSQKLPEPMDYTFVNMDFVSGLIGLAEGGWIRRGLNIGSFLYFVGTEGTICYENYDETIKVFTKKDNYEEKGRNEEIPCFLEMKVFINKLISGEDIADNISASLKDGVEALRISLSAIESIQKKEKVYLLK